MLWAGVAVGCGWQAFVAYVNVGCYYVVGIPLGCLLGFYFDLGAAVRHPWMVLDNLPHPDQSFISLS